MGDAMIKFVDVDCFGMQHKVPGTIMIPNVSIAELKALCKETGTLAQFVAWVYIGSAGEVSYFLMIVPACSSWHYDGPVVSMCTRYVWGSVITYEES